MCSSVKDDHISDDEERDVLNDCTDSVLSKLLHEASSDQVIYSMNYLLLFDFELHVRCN